LVGLSRFPLLADVECGGCKAFKTPHAAALKVEDGRLGLGGLKDVLVWGLWWGNKTLAVVVLVGGCIIHCARTLHFCEFALLVVH
jgi:hypothetical protein